MSVTPLELVGRTHEIGLIDALLAGARAQRGGAMALVGEPGSGKSTLLQEARRRADDMLVLRCVGVPWEAELPYSGLHELLRPIADDLSVLPQPQAEALGRALSARNDGPVHAMHLYAGALSLVLERTRQRPVLLIADDVQWIDEPTRQALAFIARRTNAEAVAVLGAAREVFTPGWVDAELCELTPLTECEVAALAEARLGSPLPAAAVTDLADAAHGNPLAVVEAVRRFGSELARRGAGLDDPLSVGDVIGDAYEERLAALSEAAVTVLELLALSYSDDVAIIQRALDAIGVPWTALVEAEGAGIVTVQDGHATFAHPLLRSLVFDGRPPMRGAAATRRSQRSTRSMTTCASGTRPGLRRREMRSSRRRCRPPRSGSRSVAGCSPPRRRCTAPRNSRQVSSYGSIACSKPQTSRTEPATRRGRASSASRPLRRHPTRNGGSAPSTTSPAPRST